MLVYSHRECLLKDNGSIHPEKKERLSSILSSIKEIKDFSINFKESTLADIEIIQLVHPKNYIESIFSKIPKEGLLG